MDYTAQELFELLNDTDECPFVEAKGGKTVLMPILKGKSSTSIIERIKALEEKA